MNMENLTVEDYSSWLVVTMTTMDDGPEYDALHTNFTTLWETVGHLYLCYSQPSYDPDRSD